MPLYNKLIICYVRVSSLTQNEQMQIQAAERIINQYGIGNVQFIKDIGVSATKKPMQDRTGLMKLLSLVEQNKVESILTYQRDRLARDFFEYARILKNYLYKYNVNVIFTASNSSPFQSDFSVEVLYGILSQMEGNNIQKRIRDTFSQSPARIYGYNIQKQNGQKKYELDPSKAGVIKDMFHQFSEVNNKQEFFTLINLYKRKLKRTPEEVFHFLLRPFYAGLYKHNNQYIPSKIRYPAIVDEPTFLQVQQIIEEYEYDFYEVLENQATNSINCPLYCGSCGGSLKENYENFGDNPIYKCSKNHKKIKISNDELKNLLMISLQDYLAKLDGMAIKQACLNFIRNKLHKCQQLKKKEKYTKEKHELKLAIKINPFHDKEVIKTLNKIDASQKIIDNTTRKIEVLKEAENQINNLTSMILQGLVNLSDMQKKHLFASVIDSVQIHEDYLSVSFFFNNFTKGVTEHA